MFLRSRRPSPQRAVVTGASSGIGTAFARALPKADLLLTGRDAEALEALAHELRGGNEGREIQVVASDLTLPEDRARLVEAAEGFAPDLLVNDAGLGTYGRFLQDPPERQEATVLVNALAPVALARALLPGMLERAVAGGGRCALVNLASTLAFTPVPYGAVYGATKAFVLSFTEALSAELAGQPVDVLAVCPGAVRTAFFRRAGAPGGAAPPGAYDPEQVARRALADLGRRTVAFSDAPSALVLQRVADLRVGLARSLALGIGAYQAFRGGRAAPHEGWRAEAPTPPPPSPPPPRRRAPPGRRPSRRAGTPGGPPP
jgi:short-subunit dehydrogenase